MIASNRVYLATIVIIAPLLGGGTALAGGIGPGDNGAVAEGWFATRQMGFLDHACTQWAPNIAPNVLAHLERAERDERFGPVQQVPDDAWDAAFEKIHALEDLRDFRLLEMMQVVLAYPDTPALSAELRAKLEEAILGFKYWLTDYTPDGLVDQSVYWTENHQVNYHTLEYLAGQLYPDRAFSYTGWLGSDHQMRGKYLLLQWMDRKARFGFNEWHSNVYYPHDIRPLLTLVEFAEDEEVATRAAMLLDVLLFDLAMHQHEGAFGVTHGRSYKKDKMSSLDEGTFDIAKLLFGTTDFGYQALTNPGAAMLARAKNYRVPKAIWKIARHDGTFVDRERMGIAVHEGGAPPTSLPLESPDGFAYQDFDNLMVFWGAGAMVAYPVVPLTFTAIDALGFWGHDEFALFGPFAGMPVEELVGIAWYFGAILNLNNLGQVDTYTWRSDSAMLSSAVDHRKGLAAVSAHSWQATLDPNAIVFTNHPFLPLLPGPWRSDPEAFGGYWNGEASMPRSAQHENVAVHIYAPQSYPEYPPPFDMFGHEPYTHAYFPQDHFDEVVQEGDWTLGRKGDTYVALYSLRPAVFSVYDPDVYATNGMVKPFDLVADGGAENVWIVELGTAEQYESFVAFGNAILASPVDVAHLGYGPQWLPLGFDVSYDSPSQGLMELSWSGPLVVDGVEVPTHEFPRFDNPWAQVGFGETAFDIVYPADGADVCGVSLDFEAGTRDLFCGDE